MQRMIHALFMPMGRVFHKGVSLLHFSPVRITKHALIRASGSSFIGLDLPPSPVRTIARYVHRYGLAADALIATGGLVAAARDGDGGEARRMLTLSKESLNDILTIGVNNNLNKTDP